jgi:hypothetical protein
MCCGKNRAALVGAHVPPVPPKKQEAFNAGPRPTGTQIFGAARPVTGSVSVRYVEQSSIVIRGPATGRQYAFSGTNPVQSVDARDANSLLNTRFFRRA